MINIILKNETLYITSNGEAIPFDVIGDGDVDFVLDIHPIKKMSISNNTVDLSGLSKGTYPFYVMGDSKKLASGYLELV